MNVVRGALWASDLTCGRRSADLSGYVLLSIERGWLVSELARAMEVGESEVRARLDRGARAFAAWAWHSDEIAGWVWVSTGSEMADPIRRELRFQPDECYGWGAHVLKRHRGNGLFAGLLRYAGQHMAERGYRLMWGGILDSNRASQHSSLRAGWRAVLHLVAEHEPEPTRLRTWRVEYADEHLVERARLIVA